MMTASLDLAKAINAVWDDNNLDWEFKKLWNSSKREGFEVLHDQMAGPDQPFPYMVIREETPNTTARMTEVETGENKREIREIIYQFNIHTRQFEGVDRTAKQIAGELASYVMQFYGGHPTVKPKQLELDSGSVLLAQYQTDYGVMTGEEEQQWIIRYLFRLDVPIAI